MENNNITNTPDTPRMRELYQKLAGLVTAVIPDEWSTVYLYGEILPDSRKSFFHYRRVSDNELIYCLDISSIYRTDRRIIMKNTLDINKCLTDLHDEYANNYDKAWTNLTFILENSGKFNIKYNYEDVLNCGFNDIERHMIWKYEVLGIEPEDESGKAIIQRYLESKK